MVEEEVMLEEILAAQCRELTKLHTAFATVMAGGYNFEDSMGHVVIGLEKVWELLSYAFEAAWMRVDGDTENGAEAWASLERLEKHIRRCLLLKERNIEQASMLLQIMGVMVSESERCIQLWDTV